MYDVEYKHFNEFPMDLWKWPNFSPQEIACRGDNTLKVNEEAMNKLQALRDRLGRPLIINSAYRSPSYNRKIGGATASKHMKATAFDVSMTNHDPAVFEAAAVAVGFKGFGFYQRNNFMHVDTGPRRFWGRRWFKQTGISTYSKADPKPLPKETALHPESASGDKDLVSAAVGGSGAIAGGGAVLSGLSALSPTAQIVAVVGVAVAAAALLYIFRHRLARLAR